MAKDKNVLKVLKTARGIVAKGWIREALAEDSKGNMVPVKSDKAVRFCAVGALRRAEYQLGTKGVATKARIELRKALPNGINSVISFNDRSHKTAVLTLFDTAIEKVK